MKRISTLLLVLIALMALPLTVSAEEVVFDFSSPTIRENIGEAMNDTKGWIYNETFTVKDVTLQVTAGSAASRIYVDNNRGQNLVTYKDYTTLTFKAPESYAITSIVFTAAGNSNINNFTASSGAIEGMIWTGNADGVRFQQGGTSYLANAIVTLTDKTEATTALTAIEYTECANIAAFNGAEDGQTVKLTLNNARVNGFNDLAGTYYIEDATGATAIKGINLTKGTALNGYIVGKKGTEDVDYINTPSQGLEYSLTVEDASLSAFEATATELVGTAMTITEAAQQANYGRLVTLSDVSIEAVGNGKNKQLTDANGNTIKTRDLFGVLSDTYEWPAKASKITGVVLYYMTGWFIIPISADAIVAATETASLDGKLVIGKVFYAGSIRLNDAKPKNYMKHLYIELYNNSNKTLNVAGTYIALANTDAAAAAWTAADMVDDKADCAVVKQIFQIPGTTVEMQPGKSLVITNCAVDHSEIAEGNVNLSDADFEVKSQNNAFNDHNEAVPELTVVKTFGTTDFINFLNPGPDGIVLLPANTNIAACAETYGKGKTTGNLYTVVPMANSIDCVDIVKQKTPSADDKRFLDAYDAGYACTVDINTFNCQAVARKVVSTESDGRKVLQDTNNSSEDFETLSNVAPRVYGEGIVTGIQTVHPAADTNAPVVIYNLQGVRLNSLQKGINIVNGKKVVVK